MEMQVHNLQLDVMGEGNPNADIAIVGEAPGSEEQKVGRPFVGPSGHLLNQLLQQAGLTRSECWITNVVKTEPPKVIKAGKPVYDIKGVKNYDGYKEYLIAELKTINPKIILAVGNVALQALTGNTGITQWRGSILHSDRLNKRVIPTYHPAYILRSDSIIDKSVAEFDVRRLAEEINGTPVPQRNLVVIRDSAQLYRYIDKWKSRQLATSDIETYKSIPNCIGFATSSHEAISIPLFNELWGVTFANYPRRELAEFWKCADILLRTKRIIGQNWKFDESKLKQLGFRIPNFHADTMLMSHTRYPELPKGLAFLASIHTREPYYKLEGKEFNPKKDSADRLYLYNAKDCAVDYEIFETLDRELESFGVRNFYYDFVHHLHPLYLDIERQGILCDTEVRQALAAKYEVLNQENQFELENLIGHPINVMSPKQIGQLIYNELKLPARDGTGEEVLVALQANHGERKPQVVPIIDRILRGRTIRKTIGTYIQACPDYDGRYRTSYQIVGTETGRTSTQTLKPPTRPEPIGMAFQTITKHSSMGADILSMFIVDKGYVYLEADLSQAEARVVDLLAEDYEGLLEYGLIDKHAKTARIVLSLGDDFVVRKGSPERFLGKTSRHAGSYDMGKHRAMVTFNTDAAKYGIDLHVSEYKAGQILERFHLAYPKIRSVFHTSVQNALAANERTLTTPFGRKRQFSGRWGDQMFKEAYAMIPQSTVGDQVKRAMLHIKHKIPGCRIVMEKHDAIGALVPINEVAQHALVFKEGLEMPIDFAGCSIPRGILVIPAEFEIGEKNLHDLIPYSLS
jgi:DNA polymerase-1